jgi:hypothetical protein
MRLRAKQSRRSGTALRIVTALLLAQAVIRGGITIYLWVTFPTAASDRAGVIAAFVLGWVPLTCLNIATAAGIARRKSWAPLVGLAVCGIGALIDACFMFLTVGYWTSESSPDWVFFDLVLWTSSTAYIVVYVISLIYLYRVFRLKSRAT